MSNKNLIVDIFNKLSENIDSSDITNTFENMGIDSIDLVAARVEIENRLQFKFLDAEWLEFICIGDIINYADQNSPNHKTTSQNNTSTSLEKMYEINMPQMAIEALSESWLFKELGSSHWEMLCKGLNANSFDLSDSIGNRLYATFVRIRLNFSNSLQGFKENQKVKMTGSISRYGESMYFSKINFGANSTFVEADLMTTFSIRNDSDNKRLTKSQPKEGVNTIVKNDELPKFGNDYRLIKKQELREIGNGNISFQISNEIIFETEYHISPYHDLNGVGLLYFAAYPIINDICEAKYFNSKQAERWELQYFTAYKDVLYYGNCNLEDTIIYQLHYVENIDSSTVKIASSLVRKSDNKLMAKIFTIKKKSF